jgi:hypothetical protein
MQENCWKRRVELFFHSSFYKKQKCFAKKNDSMKDTSHSNICIHSSQSSLTMSSYVIQDAALSDPLHSDTFHSKFMELLALSPETRKEQLLEEHKIGLGIFQIHVFSHSWCSRLIKELRSYQEFMKAQEMVIQRPNSMNHYGVILDQLGLHSFFDEVLQKLIPITSLLFANKGRRGVA